MYAELSPADKILLAISYVLNDVPIPSTLAEVIDPVDLEDIKNPVGADG